VFVDNTSRAAQIDDESGVEFVRAVEVLTEACREVGLTTLIDVHHKKGYDSIENKTRGGTGVQGAVDINVEIKRVGGFDSRRRRLTAFGGVSATHWQNVIEHTGDGEYTLVDDGDLSNKVDEDTRRQFTDHNALRECGTGTRWPRFAKEIGVSTATAMTARGRLNALVDAGLAVRQKRSGRNPDRWDSVEQPASGDDLPIQSAVHQGY
jgi:hypothetical protein